MLRENKSCFQHCDDTTYFFKPEYARLVRYSQYICGCILLFQGLGIIRYSQFTVDAYCYLPFGPIMSLWFRCTVKMSSSFRTKAWNEFSYPGIGIDLVKHFFVLANSILFHQSQVSFRRKQKNLPCIEARLLNKKSSKTEVTASVWIIWKNAKLSANAPFPSSQVHVRGMQELETFQEHQFLHSWCSSLYLWVCLSRCMYACVCFRARVSE